MQLDHLPQEVLHIILHHVLEPKEPQWLDEPVPANQDFDSLCMARLVCRRFNSITEPILYHTVALLHTSSNDTFPRWNSILDNQRARQLVRHVEVHASPKTRGGGKEYTDDLRFKDLDKWYAGRWDWSRDAWRGSTGAWPAFTNAIGRIKSLDTLRSVDIVFSRQCYGLQNDLPISHRWPYECLKTRIKTLEAVFDALRERAGQDKQGQASTPTTVSVLTIVNLQNLPTPEFTTSGLFRDVMSRITHLNLSVTVELAESPDGDLYQVERNTFAPYMAQHWLTAASANLRELTLSFREPWGSGPDYFNPRDLSLPCLEVLNLGSFVISHHDHVDWILNQRATLKALRLNDCCVATHMAMSQELMDQWELPTHDWKRMPPGSYGFGIDSDDECAFTFDGTWEALFDRFRTELPHLIDFQLAYLYSDGRLPNPANMGCHLGPKRYMDLNLEIWHCETWPDTMEDDGEMKFGTNEEAAELNKLKDIGHWSDETLCSLNMAKKYHDGDNRALNELLRTVRDRSRKQ